MNMISEQIHYLRSLENIEIRDCDLGEHEIEFQLAIGQAADTIEALSAKLANMERPEADCGGGWIPCDERLPEKVGNYIIHVKTGTDEDYVGVWCYQRGVHLSGRQTYIDDKQGYWASPYNGDPINKPLSKRVVAWQPLPEPYTENEVQHEQKRNY